MGAMARRKISNRGRVLAAGLCLGATGLLAGLMAATDDTGNASAGTSSGGSSGAIVPGSSNSGFDGSSDTDGDGRVGDPGDYSGVHGQVPSGFGDDRSSSAGSSAGSSGSTSPQPSQQPAFPQPNTRSGGS
jgi:hypothetical protein